MVILTLDLGTTVTKADLWDETGRLASGRAELDTTHPEPDRVEQDPTSWWPAVLDACAQARAAAPAAWAEVGGIGFAAARQTLVAVASDGSFLGPALVWSDRRAGAEAAVLAERLGGDEAVRQRTGQYLRATSVPAKLAWLAGHHPELVADARWILSPRDWMIWRLTDRVATDPTLASATGLYDRVPVLGGGQVGRVAGVGGQLSDLIGDLIDELAGPWADHLAEVRPSASVAGGLTRAAATELGLGTDVEVVIGAGDRACEVVGSGADARHPMVSWGTAANMSRPGWSAGRDVPPGLVATRSLSHSSRRPPRRGGRSAARPVASTHGEQLEGGLSAAGSILAWLSGLTGRPVDDLVAAAADRPPGAGGLVVLPWLDGARAPWWDDTASAAILGLRAHTEPADLARAVLEGVAREVARVLAALDPEAGSRPDRTPRYPRGTPASELPGAPPEPRLTDTASRPDGTPRYPRGTPASEPPRDDHERGEVEGLVLTGRGAGSRAWVEIVAGVTGLAVQLRRSGQAAAVGAALVTADALGQAWTLDQLDPVVRRHQGDGDLVEHYRSSAPEADRLASTLIPHPD